MWWYCELQTTHTAHSYRQWSACHAWWGWLYGETLPNPFTPLSSNIKCMFRKQGFCLWARGIWELGLFNHSGSVGGGSRGRRRLELLAWASDHLSRYCAVRGRGGGCYPNSIATTSILIPAIWSASHSLTDQRLRVAMITGSGWSSAVGIELRIALITLHFVLAMLMPPPLSSWWLCHRFVVTAIKWSPKIQGSSDWLSTSNESFTC